MYLLYGDESGDAGFNSNLRHFVLNGIVVHESDWATVSQSITTLKQQYFPAIHQDVELHYKQLRTRKGIFKILSTKEQSQLEDQIFQLILDSPVNIISETIDKFAYAKSQSPNTSVDIHAFKNLMKTYEQFLSAKQERGIVILDERSRDKLFREALNYLQTSEFNWIIETIFFAPSQHLDLIQLADFCAYSVLSHHEWQHTEKYNLILSKIFPTKNG